MLPYTDGDSSTVAQQIIRGERPSRPMDPRQNRWLQDPVWDVIASGWSVETKRRYKLSVMHKRFFTAGQHEAQNVKRGNLFTRNYGSHTIVESPKRQNRATAT